MDCNSKIIVIFAQSRYVRDLHRGKLLSFDPSENLENSCSMGKSLKAVLPVEYILHCFMSGTAHIYPYRCELIFILHATGIPEPSDREWQEAHTLCACMWNLKSLNMKPLKEQIESYFNLRNCKSGKCALCADLQEVQRMKEENSTEELLKRCVCNRGRHQQRIRESAVTNAVESLLKRYSDLEKCKDFESLYDMVYETIAKKKTSVCTYISYSTVYDTALRLGYSFDKPVMPNKYVYVHRHLLKEANDILGQGCIQDHCRVERRLFDEKEKDFEKLCSAAIEDFLCLRPKL